MSNGRWEHAIFSKSDRRLNITKQNAPQAIEILKVRSPISEYTQFQGKLKCTNTLQPSQKKSHTPGTNLCFTGLRSNFPTRAGTQRRLLRSQRLLLTCPNLRSINKSRKKATLSWTNVILFFERFCFYVVDWKEPHQNVQVHLLRQVVHSEG